MKMAKQKESKVKLEPLLLRAEQASAICGLSVSTWYEYMSAGRIPPSIKIGKARLWRLEILRRWCQWDCPPIDKFNQLLATEGKR
jgi:predicted DNA-binding transcriptional regulator AlpA